MALNEDLVGFVKASLQHGAATARFALKVLTVALIAGSAFGYYLRDLREAETDPET